ncbi:MAG: hypothetical protein AABX54_00260 [Nanoarchaeota archaeon]
MKRALRYLLALILIIVLIALGTSTFQKYHVLPSELYTFNSQNLIDDGNFENFNQTAGDCCTTPENAKEAIINASQSLDSYEGRYSLNLTSSNHCACINKPIKDFNNTKKYFITFYYKGNNPKLCNWVSNDNKCLPDKSFEKSSDWKKYYSILIFTNNSRTSSVYFYANSDGKEKVTNLYDSLEVHQLTQMSPSSYPYKSNEQYIIKTDTLNVVHNPDAIKINDNGYYLIIGTPNITLEFPWTELIIILVIGLIVIRLLFKKPYETIDKSIEREMRLIEKGIKKDIEKTINWRREN